MDSNIHCFFLLLFYSKWYNSDNYFGFIKNQVEVAMKYGKKLVIDYVNGNEINGYDVLELENDYRFMMDVIKYTKDKNVYKYCSDNVRYNYTFVKFLIEFFKNDWEFVLGVSESFLERLDYGNIKELEIMILVLNNLKNIDDYKFFEYKAKIDNLYNLVSFRIECTYDCNPGCKDEYGMGFVFVLEDYGDSKIVVDYLAKRFVWDIFNGNSMYNFEELMHSEYKEISLEEGINNFVINYIRRYDEYLANYIEVNVNLLGDVKTRLMKIIDNWDRYLDNVNRKRLERFYLEVDSVFKKYGNEISFSEDVAINYVINKLGLLDFFDKYDNLDSDIYDELGENYRNYLKRMRYGDGFISKDCLSVIELRCLKDIINMTKNLFERDVISKDIEIVNYNYMGNVVMVDFVNSKRKKQCWYCFEGKFMILF